jgi:alpha-tubulin suppressor-like RCC1 family protein
VQAFDAFGNMVGGQQATIISQNAAVAALDGGAIARATGNGTTRLIATVQGSTAADTTTVTVQQTVTAVSAVGATSRTGTAGTAVADSLTVRVVDRDGNGVPGVTVAFAAPDGGSLSPATATTRADGTARAQWTLGPAAGQQTATATVAGLPAVTFTAAAGPGAVSRVVLTPESISFDALGQRQALTVQAFDAFGNMVGGQRATVISQNSAVAALDIGPTVRAVANGTTRLIATVQGSTAADTTTVTVQQVIASVLAERSVTAPVGTTFSLRQRALDVNGHIVDGATFSFSSSTPNLAVSAAGVVSVLDAPGGTITTTAGGKSAITEVIAIGYLGNLRDISAGESHACALEVNGGLYCWGLNTSGQLLNGEATGPDACRATSTGCYTRAIRVESSVPFAQIVVGKEQTCALSFGSPARVYCSGAGNRLAAVPGGLFFTILGRGARPNCALMERGEAYCGLSASAAPVRVAGQTVPYDAISTGGGHTCALDYEGRAYCWGENGAGELGNGTTTPSATPVVVAGDLRFSSISAGEGVGGGGFTCGVTQFTGDAYCWGANNHGQLGNGTTNPSTVPVKVSGGREWRSIRAGQATTCATSSNRIYCWGVQTRSNSGVTASTATPAAVEDAWVGISGRPDFDAGAGFGCSIDVNRNYRAVCWGSNAWGQLGNGTTQDSPAATDVQRR